VSENQNFSSTQTIDFDTVNFTVLDQNTSLQNTVSSTTSTSTDFGTLVTRDEFSFPIALDFVYPVSTSPFGYNVSTAQKYHTSNRVSIDGFVIQDMSATNSVSASDVSPATSSQTYTSFDSDSEPYSCHIATSNNTLTGVGPGCKHRKD